MFRTVLFAILDLWNAWASMFAWLPQGDPYVAFVVLFALICIAVALLPRMHLRVLRLRGKDLPTDQLERVARVLNIRV